MTWIVNYIAISSPFLNELTGSVLVYQAAKRAAGAKGKKFELTEEQKQEIREAFDLFDTDGSGDYELVINFCREVAH
jgi:hypothetical protein